jgi:predicted transcriptional regulator
MTVGARGPGPAPKATKATKATKLPTAPKVPEEGPRQGRAREISDPRSMRAFAHPVRIALIEALRREGALTATRAAEILDDSPGNMSWHLQTLAKYGFIEEAAGGRGRSRPWRLAAQTYSFETALDDPESAAAGEVLEANLHEHNYRRLREWWSVRRSYPAKWRQAAFSSNSVVYLTAEETSRLSEDIREVLDRYRAAGAERGKGAPEALPVRFVAFAHPLPPTPSAD